MLFDFKLENLKTTTCSVTQLLRPNKGVPPSLRELQALKAILYALAGCKENHFYSLPFGQAEASSY